MPDKETPAPEAPFATEIASDGVEEIDTSKMVDQPILNVTDIHTANAPDAGGVGGGVHDSAGDDGGTLGTGGSQREQDQ